MKHINKFLAILSLILGCTFNVCTHVHDEYCGYDSETQSGCTHECTESVLPCDKREPDNGE